MKSNITKMHGQQHIKIVCNVLLQIVICCQMTASTLESAAVKHK